MQDPDLSPAIATAHRIAQQFAALPQVQAVALSGSRTSQTADANSDIDLYVYVTETIPLAARREIAAGALRAEIGNQFWEPGDEWIDADSGISLDVMYRDTRWMREQIERVLVHHQASIGYTTCFWYNVLHSEVIFDREGWLAELQRFCRQPYPPELKRAILRKNYPILRQNQSSYLHQIELAIRRGDPVSINHRLTALLASYFDILFAVNELPHPGEKRLSLCARRNCRTLPTDMEADIRELLAAAPEKRLSSANKLLDGLDQFLENAGLLNDMTSEP